MSRKLLFQIIPTEQEEELEPFYKGMDELGIRGNPEQTRNSSGLPINSDGDPGLGSNFLEENAGYDYYNNHDDA